MESATPPHAGASGTGYEFTPAQNEVIRKTGSRTWLWGLISLLGGLLMVLGGLSGFLAGESLAFGLGVAVGYTILALIPIYVGVNFMRAGTAMKAVVSTAGSDIEHLMGAVQNLGTAFLIQLVAFAAWFVLIFLGVVAAILIPVMAG